MADRDSEMEKGEPTQWDVAFREGWNARKRHELAQAHERALRTRLKVGWLHLRRRLQRYFNA